MTFDEFSAILLERFPKTSPQQMDSFRKMESLYQDWNSKINVISRKDMDSLYDHHVLHSLAIAAYIQEEGIDVDTHRTVLDLGTGGGFPGIPLAVMFPQWDFVLCDSVGKKTIVASAVSQSLALPNVTVVNARAESLGKEFDYVVSRAVTTLTEFYPWVKDQFTGSIFYLKGGDVNVEISDLLRKYKLQPSSVHAWPVDNFLKDHYFAEKFVIQIEKSYICNPNVVKYKKSR